MTHLQSRQTVTPQFGASLTGDSRVVIYNRNIFIIQATGIFIVQATGVLFPVKFFSG
jgi:hypothetical protein